MILIAAPGQGSQTPGFLAPWLELDGVRETLGELGEAAGIDLIEHGTNSDAETIKDTRVAQPLIVAAGIVAYDALVQQAQQFGKATAGHSVGELTAMYVAGILSREDAMKLVGIRGRAMAEAAALTPTGMAAVIGADPEELEAKLEELGLSAANYNGGGQIVVAGDREALESLAADAPAKSRVIALQTAGAFHTHFMEPAVDALREAAGELDVDNPQIPIYSNHHGAKVETGHEFVDLVVGQVASPVRWDKSMETFVEDGLTGMIELAPAGALTGLAKRGMRGTPVAALKTPDDLQAAADLLQGDTE
ncbi:ACP S-malonyltransferase [Agrococcus casei]|uniref:ACP S-malonyltransferase n=1 Tax=Agrococcus casei TaxID=343512 RepID=UPI003F927D53